ncbi:hypothetical protein [Capnocytophaga catalasegens]|uniref:Uncharacterized protein n=1 Tax=Capnocytophaga catalasegens TaxID=1004260 RepID=A0AAV5AQF4_9FLAO|nr:hypothetical protein [Capnocytophaga catalasegens]GIZ15756.1 hypothetical protein RCZ03_17560 [Capnocytophaga catalasegens]GJM49497.1 hypothetical protein RCZ15_04720 [Capnocytophaga catalasegens]GJM54223.1 hypothetical protein RCZ16_25390 [Capnocytophaga catalasegens]
MKTSEQMPRPLSQKFGQKLSFWLNIIISDIISDEDFKEKIFDIIELSYIGDNCFTEENNKLIAQMLSKILSLAFILEKNQQEIEDFFEDYN